jgi:hypothetical protein
MTDPSKDIVPVPPERNKDMVPLGQLGDVMKFAESISRSALVPGPFRGKPADIAIAILWGAELGIEPMAALQGVDVIDGRPSFKAEIRLAVLRQKGHHVGAGRRDQCRRCMGDPTLPSVEFVVDRCATIHAKRKDNGDEETVTYSIKDATLAQLTGKSNWKKSEDDMLFARVVTRLGRRLFSDVLMGLTSDEDENEEIAQDTRLAALPPEQQPTVRRGPPAPAVEDIAEAEIVDEPAANVDGELLPIGDPVFDGPITKDQTKHLHAAFGDIGWGSKDMREAKLAFAIDIIGHPIDSSLEMTSAEADAVIEALEREKLAAAEAIDIAGDAAASGLIEDAEVIEPHQASFDEPSATDPFED